MNNKHKNYKHGLCEHPLYNVWKNMKKRCYNKNVYNYKSYGGRGIIVCDEWRNNFKAFYDWALNNDYEKGLEIDRVDNDGNYEPSNCRFVTRSENQKNKRVYGKIKIKHITKHGNGYKIQKQINGRTKHVGTFKTVKEAINKLREMNGD